MNDDNPTLPLPRMDDAHEPRRRSWKRPALLAGAVIVAAGLTGGTAALASSGGMTPVASVTSAPSADGVSPSTTTPTPGRAPSGAPTAPADGTAPTPPADGAAPAAPGPGAKPGECGPGGPGAPTPPADGTAPTPPTDGTAPTPPTPDSAPGAGERPTPPTDGTAPTPPAPGTEPGTGATPPAQPGS